MPLFGPYTYKKKEKKEVFYLHMKQKGKATFYYFSKNPEAALGSLPKGFEVLENSKSGLPYLKKIRKEEKKEDQKKEQKA
jgi:hypothetical protein